MLRNIYRSKLVGNILNLFLLQGFSYIFPILLIPFLTKTIGIEKYGLIYFSLAFAFYFQIVAEFGFDLSNVKHVIENKNNNRRLSEIFSSIITAKIGIAILLFFLYIGIVFAIPKFREYSLLYIIGYTRIFGIMLMPNWLFRSMENIKYITRISILVKCIIISSIFFLVRNDGDYLLVIISFSLVEIISGIISFYYAKKLYKLHFCVVSISTIKYYLKDSFPFFTSTLMTNLYTNSNLLVIGLFLGDFSAGIYSIAEKLYKPYTAVVAPLIQHVFYPYFVRIKDFFVINKIILYSFILNIIIVATMYLIAPYVLPVFVKESYNEISGYFNLFLLLLLVDVPGRFLGYPFLGSMNKVKYVNSTAIYSSLFHIMGLILLLLLHVFTVKNAILLLIFTQIFCLLQRIYFIYK